MAFTLPPVHSLPGYNTSGVPTANPASGRQPFWLDDQGQPIGVTNAGEAVYVPQAGAGYNPLWYGQTAFHTGPTGATDHVPSSSSLPEVQDAVASTGDPQGVPIEKMFELYNRMMFNNDRGRPPIFGNMGMPDIFKIFKKHDDGSYYLPDESTGAYGSEYFYNKAGVPLHKQITPEGSEVGIDRALVLGGNRLSEIDELQ